jgi:hypothetical protein
VGRTLVIQGSWVWLSVVPCIWGQPRVDKLVTALAALPSWFSSWNDTPYYVIWTAWSIKPGDSRFGNALTICYSHVALSRASPTALPINVVQKETRLVSLECQYVGCIVGTLTTLNDIHRWQYEMTLECNWISFETAAYFISSVVFCWNKTLRDIYVGGSDQRAKVVIKI